MTKLLLGKPVAERLAEKICAELQMSAPAKLVTLGFAEPQWLQYTASLKKSGESFSGISVENILAEKDDARNFVQNVSQICLRGDVDGILLQQPLPAELASAADALDPSKDVDCLGAKSVARLYRGSGDIFPATPTAVLHLLDFYGIELCGKNVVVVGRGNAVGKPLALMLLRRNATVTVCHTKTENLRQIAGRADIIVSACGVAGLIKPDFVTENTVVVDVGLSFVEGKTCGDVAPEVLDVARAVSPVPGGVGPVTRIALLENLLKAKRNAAKIR